jgi:hypothetical protein
MNFSQTSTPSLSVYINGNYVTIAEIATAVQINLEAGAVFSSTPSLAGIGLTYNQSGNPQFISGDPIGAHAAIVINLTNAASGSEVLTVEVVKPTFNITVDDCTRIQTITDTMITSNPALTGRGSIAYSILVDNTWRSLGSVSRGGSRQVDFTCYEPGTYDIKAVMTIRAVPNCGGTSPIIFQAEYTAPYDIIAYLPTISTLATTAAVMTGDCCLAVKDVDVVVTPTWVLNNPGGCTVVGAGGPVDAIIKYTLYDFNGTELSTLSFDIVTGVTLPADVLFTFTPVETGDYKVVTTITTCCGSSSTDLVVAACNYVTITNDCHKHTIHNMSLDKTLTLDLYDKTLEVLVQTDVYPITILPGNSYDIELTGDGIFVAKVVSGADTFYFPIIDYCDLRSCLQKVIRAILCQTDICGCSNAVDGRYLLNRLIANGQYYFSLLQGQYGFNNMYTALQPNTLQDLFDLDETFKRLMKFCDSDCVSKDQNMSGGCSGCS